MAMTIHGRGYLHHGGPEGREREAETKGWDYTFPRSMPSDLLPPWLLIATASQENTSSCVYITGARGRASDSDHNKYPVYFRHLC